MTYRNDLYIEEVLESFNSFNHNKITRLEKAFIERIEYPEQREKALYYFAGYSMGKNTSIENKIDMNLDYDIVNDPDKVKELIREELLKGLDKIIADIVKDNLNTGEE